MITMDSIFIEILALLLTSFLGFYFTQKLKIDEEKRKYKQHIYKEFVSSLSLITDSEITPEWKIKHAKVTNDMLLVADTRVLKKLIEYQDIHLNWDSKEVLQALSRLIHEMREWLNIKTDKNIFLRLWTSGNKS